MMQALEYLRITRNNTLNLVNDLSTAELTQIPEGFRNTIGWNFGHILVTQQLLCYKLSGKPMNISDELVEKFRKGTQGNPTISASEIQEVKFLFLDTVNALKSDYVAGLFEDYTTYQTSFGIELTSIEGAIAFNNIHEGLHLGYMMAMRKLV